MRPDRVGEHRTAFEKNRQIILATQNICGLCHLEIDPRYKSPHPLSATVDHIIPVAKGGHPSDLANLQAAHRCCNLAKKDKLLVEQYRKKMANDPENKFFQENRKDIASELPQHFDWGSYKVRTGATAETN